MSDPAWLGIDLGTQSVKVIAVTNDGRALARSSHPLSSEREGESHEQSPQEWRDVTARCLREVTKSLPNNYFIAGLSTCATSGTLTVASTTTTEPGNVAIMYDDTRARAFTAEAQSVGQKVWSRLGYSLQDSWALPAMLRWLAIQPLGKHEVFITQADVITWFLAGSAVASDSSHTLKAGLDLDTVSWPEAVFKALDVPARALNEVVVSGTVIGNVCEAASSLTGLAKGTPIVAGMTDGSAAQIAAGAVAPGRWNSVLGTTLVLKGSSARRYTDMTKSIYCHLAPFSSGWWPGGASNTGTRAINETLPSIPLADLHLTNSLIRDTPVHYPLVGTGERFPFVVSRATSFVVPSSMPALEQSPHRRFSSIALGVALIERLCLDVASQAGYAVDGYVSLTGGASTNEEWNQLRSTVLNRPCEVPSITDSAFGMAILARAGIEARGKKDFERIVESMVTPGKTFTPEMRLHETVKDKYFVMLDELRKRNWISTELSNYARGNCR